MAPHSRRKLTYQDYEQIPEDRLRHEILDGVHVTSPSPGTLHQRVSLRLGMSLGRFVEENPFGEVFMAPFDVLLSEHDIVIPDLLFISTERAAILTEANVQGAPDLMIEIVTPGTRRRDLGVKRARYERLGVLEYWALDPKADRVWVFRREGEAFLPPRLLTSEDGDRLTTPLLPGFELPLGEAFRR